MPSPLTIASLQSLYASGAQSPEKTVEEIFSKIEARGPDPTWITVVSRESALGAAKASTLKPGKLSGLPFAIKDNLDLANVPTTAGCPDFAYTPAVSAVVVQKLIDAGAIPIGKTNLDQFATGLVGVRSPYGIPQNPFNADYIPGGSSAGSAVALANGLCSFSLGTDTAGSGRVPAAFNNLVGLKPTKGLLSTRGVVPACRSLDCVSIFAHTCSDAAQVLNVAAGYDAGDPFSRRSQPPPGPTPWPPRIGVPRAQQREFFGDSDAAKLFALAVAKWQTLGARVVEIDFDPFLQAARLLYEGAWVAERYFAAQALLEKKPESLFPVTRQIIEGARGLSAFDAFRSSYRLAELKRASEKTWEQVDVMLTPTTGTAYRIAEVLTDPIRLNSQLGHYTNFVNLFDLCAVALPAGKLSCGVPWGITLHAPAFHDDRLLSYGARFGGEAAPLASLTRVPESPETVRVAVCGAHLSGLPLNGQLLERGGRLVSATRTAPEYRLFELPGTVPPKPGLVRVKNGGMPIQVEVWEIPVETYGSFVAGIPAPLGIGRIHLENGELVQGFLCETVALDGARDVSEFGGWRAFLESKRA